MQPAKKVVLNTGILYGKVVIVILISLYSTRLILHALGEVDYGIFNLIGGVIAMLSFINGAMIIATQRYLSISLGAGDIKKLKAVFSSSIVLHLIISLVIVLILELAALFLFGYLDIPEERIATAKIIFHLTVVSTFFSINAVPYDASINTHENMLFDALIGIIEALLKLGIAFWITYSGDNKLVFYGLLIALLTILSRIVKVIYCKKKYVECNANIKTYLESGLLKEMLAFAGWNVFGLFCSVLKSQGLAVLLNLFFGVVVNAAYGIANTVNANIRIFSTNLIRAIMPQIAKSEGGGDHERMLRLSVFASKMSFFLLAFFAIPFIVEMPFVLKVWLDTVPENTVIFCQLILVLSLLYQITIGTMTSVTSVGNIRSFQIAVGAVEIFNLPICYALLKMGLPAYSVFIGSIVMELIAGAVRLWYSHKIAGLNIREFLIKTWLFSFFSVAAATLLSMALQLVIEQNLLRALLVLITTSVTLLLMGRYLVFTSEEIARLKEVLASILSTVKTKYFFAEYNEP